MPSDGAPRLYTVGDDKTCACGTTYRGRARKCLGCREKDRSCTGCGTQFRGAATKCSACTRPERVCPDCGQTHRSTSFRCRRCTYKDVPERPCASCGEMYVPATGSRRCWRCRQTPPERSCAGCGKSYRGTALRCERCRAVDQTCTECGRTFRERSKRPKCSSCRRPARECEECSRPFRGLARRCPSCQVKDRECTECGVAFRGSRRLCNQCGWRARPYDRRNSQARAAVNKRRATKLSAAVCGPVPPEVYAALRASPECVYCGAPPEHVDHVRPLADGGWEHESNLVPACSPCNHSKGAKLLSDWDPVRVRRGAKASEKVAAEVSRLASGRGQLPLVLID